MIFISKVRITNASNNSEWIGAHQSIILEIDYIYVCAQTSVNGWIALLGSQFICCSGYMDILQW